ncbi:MAG: FKBP-type peptidyl-prolyl cis-trans isomerase [Deltaproteobacteria bacterium]|nr:FKBP-type peptidyl-prolyl cis-trans isomerase [Deltaproteobacteria bacterium]
MNHVTKDCAVRIAFTLTSELPDGTTKKRPEETVEFILGVEPQPPTLENALKGAQVGQHFSLKIPPEELYGEHDPELIREIPKKGLIKQRVKEGVYYRQMKMGTLVGFKVLEVRPETVLADFNPPMAGISAHMDVRITGIREADESEIAAARETSMKKRIGCG